MPLAGKASEEFASGEAASKVPTCHISYGFCLPPTFIAFDESIKQANQRTRCSMKLEVYLRPNRRECMRSCDSSETLDIWRSPTTRRDVLRPIYTVRPCRIQQAYERRRNNSCRRPVVLKLVVCGKVEPCKSAFTFSLI